ncbi:MlaD family protein [Nocardia sp. NPDC052278]|uniref:MlaD family protein n=1 Tax=unclassified Nocardia TaxID=2637762 RepID=UPI0036966968
MNVRNITSIGAMIMVVAASLAYMVSVGLPVTDKLGVRTAQLKISHSNGLVVGSRVLYRGVPIGRVTDVHTSLTGVTIGWNYKDSYTIPVRSQFRVDSLSVLGEAYLNVVPPSSDSGPGLPAGAVLTAQSVSVPTSFDELSQRLVKVLEQVRTDKVDQIVAEMNQGLVVDQNVLANLNRAGVLLQTTILSTRTPFTALLDKFQDLLARGADLSGSLAESGDPVRDLGEQIKVFLDWCTQFVRTDNLPTELTNGAGPFLERLQGFLDKAAPNIKVIGDASLPAISAVTSQLRTVDLGQLMRIAMSVSGTGDGLVVNVGAPGPN